MIRVDRNALYEKDLPEPGMVELLETLMRNYTGIFSFPVTIKEDFVADSCSMSVPMLRQMLYRLSLEHIISYVPADHSTVIILHHCRLAPGNVDLKPRQYGMLKDNCERRKEAMVDYATQTSLCRSQYLVRYFGQSESRECGTCDVCLIRRASC